MPACRHYGEGCYDLGKDFSFRWRGEDPPLLPEPHECRFELGFFTPCHCVCGCHKWIPWWRRRKKK